MSCGGLLESAPSLVADPHGSFHLDLGPERGAARQAREFVLEHATPLPSGELEALRLLTSEVVGNAVIHARTPVRVGVTISDREVLVAVHDRDRLMPEQRPYTHETLGGRGLALVEELADEWGVHRDDHGKSVWFCLRRASADHRWGGDERA